jgi:AAA domain
MTSMRVLTAADRQREPRGTSIVLAGPAGIGKTYALQTLDAKRTLVVDVDRGALPLRNFPVDIVRPSGWPEIADLFAAIGGPNPSLPPTSAYSEAHFEKARGLIDVDRYDVIVFDSFTQVGRESYRYAEAYPDSPPRHGGKDTRAAYGQHARQMIAGLQHAQRGAPNKIIIMTAILERITDDAGRVEQRIQLQGDQSSRELPGIVDHIITLNWIAFNDSKPPVRAFICSAPNAWDLPAKSRSDRLDPVEPPNLGKLIQKLLNPAQPAVQETKNHDAV